MASPDDYQRKFSDAERTRHLDDINRVLADHGVDTLVKIHDWSKERTDELVRIIDVFERSAPWRLDVLFETRDRDGDRGELTLTFNPANPVIIVPVIRSDIGFVKTPRASGRFPFELPRGFGPGAQTDPTQLHQVAGLPDEVAHIAVRKLGPEIVNDSTVRDCLLLGEIDENTGASIVTVKVYLLFLDVDENVLSERKTYTLPGGHSLYAWSPAKIKEQIGHNIRDNHSISALSLARLYFERQALYFERLAAI